MAFGRAWGTAGSRFAKAALAGVSFLAFDTVLHLQPANAQTASVQPAGTVNVSVPAGSLESGLLALGRQANLRMVYPSNLTWGKRTAGVSGRMTPQQAVTQLLAGTGLNAAFTSANTVTVTGPGVATGGAANVAGAIQLDTVNVSGGRISPSDAPFQTPAPVAYISRETIDRFRGSSPADIFRGTPGVMSGEPRNGAGSIDVNIRGMQGMGRVAVTIDGAENGIQVYQGYQGISNRTFVDPDLLAGADIRKGADASSRGIAGTVAMRTLSADDVVKPGETWGVWVKSGFGTNTATPRPGNLGGYTWPISYYENPGPAPTAQASGLDRPGFLNPTSGSFSTVAAIKEDNYDLLWGYAFRKQGNYFAGKNGSGAQVVDLGPQPFCTRFGCDYPPYGSSYDHVYRNGGLSSYRTGEQVLNTQLETESYLAKATVRDVENGQSLQIGYNGYRGTSGDMVASLFGSPTAQSVQQWQENSTKVDTGTARYRWKPEDNGLVDFRANFWMTSLTMRTPPRGSITAGSARPEDFGLPYTYFPGNDSVMFGGDVSNRSHFTFDQFGSLDLDYGVSYINEATKPLPYSDQMNLNIPTRNGTREEFGGFGKIAYKPVDWLMLNAGLRYSQYSSLDRSNITTASQVNPLPSRESSGYSPSAGVVLEPVKGVQLYGNYSSALRMPTLFESVAAYTLTVNPNLGPERSNNWEGGVNLIKDNAFLSKDKAMLKFGYFNWDVKDYVARQYTVVRYLSSGTPVMGLKIYNIDRARFEGLELSGRYEVGGFTADLAANYYLNVEFCPTAGTCSNSTLSSDYATNQVPPEYFTSLTLSQKLLNDDLTVGGRVSYTGPRSVGHEPVVYGAAGLITPIDWKPYWMIDLFTEYKLSKDITLWASVENLTDQYYVDPLSLVQQPGPGRTARLGVTGKFGGGEPVSYASLAGLFSPSQGDGKSWTGFHAGLNSAYNFAELRGASTALDGSLMRYSASEAPNQDIKALSFGLQAGYDYQFSNRIVAGLAADIAKSTISGSQVTFATEGATTAVTNNMFRQRAFEAVQTSSIDWISTVRGRLGYAFNDRMMLYVTGGAAFMRQNEERTQHIGARSIPGCCSAVDSSVAAFTESASLTRTGYAIGGGGEFALDGHWSVNGEYLLARFDDAAFNFPQARAGAMPININSYPVTSDTVNGRKLISKVDIPMLRVGVNYRF